MMGGDGRAKERKEMMKLLLCKRKQGKEGFGSRREEENFFSSSVVLFHSVMPTLFYNQIIG